MESPSTPELMAHLRGGHLLGPPKASSLKVKDIVSRNVCNSTTVALIWFLLNSKRTSRSCSRTCRWTLPFYTLAPLLFRSLPLRLAFAILFLGTVSLGGLDNRHKISYLLAELIDPRAGIIKLRIGSFSFCYGSGSFPFQDFSFCFPSSH